MVTKKTPVKTPATAKKKPARVKKPAGGAAATAKPKLRVSANAKEAATRRGEPYVSVVSVELDQDNVGNGAFELDWNDIFVAKLIRAGYEGKDDAQIVDRWFQNICRHVVMETWEQEQAINPDANRVVQTRNIGGGRTEVS